MCDKRTARAITANETAEYRKNGVVKLPGIFDLGWIDCLREAVEAALANPGPLAEEYAKGGGRFFGDLDVAKRHAAFRNFVHNSPAAEIVGTIMDSSKVNFFYDQLLVKEPGTAEPTPWHQDQPYWAVSGWQVISIWLPLDYVAKGSSLKYVKGSHHWGPHNPHNFADDTPYQGTGLPELPDINANRADYEFLGWDMEPGDCLVFQGMIVHGSDGNTSLQNRRRALATRWTGDDARYAVRSGQTAIPTSDPGLKHGDLMDCDDFPVIWRKGS
jgi:ectoine hydroxylase-related dioxygenase (phytanoyl-CoA dioxygenase family)